MVSDARRHAAGGSPTPHRGGPYRGARGCQKRLPFEEQVDAIIRPGLELGLGDHQAVEGKRCRYQDGVQTQSRQAPQDLLDAAALSEAAYRRAAAAFRNTTFMHAVTSTFRFQ